MRTLLIALLFFSPLLFGKEEIPVPEMQGPVTDQVGLFSPAQKDEIEAALLKLHNTGHIQMAILVVSSLDGRDIESYSVAVFEKWKLGTKRKDEGLLFVIAPNERRMRFEVGYGLEGDIPDAFAKQVQTKLVQPAFRAQQYANGVLLAIGAIGQRLKLDLNVAVKPMPRQRRLPVWPLILLACLLFPLLSFILSVMSPGSRRWGGRGRDGYWGGGGFGGGGWGGGGFGGGGFSGGGGSSGGGGASSSW